LRFNRVLALILSSLLILGSSAMARVATVSKHHTRAKSSKTKSKKGKKSWKSKGQQAIASDRTTEIQQALIRQHYLSGEPSGTMDSATKQALTKLQEDNGWQTKVVPDSRALIKLGLGPSQSNLLNPDTAALAGSVAPSRSER
jgi:peptidoglycan hydrolase-like protein with peptidoglycan-binding domain